MPTIKTLTIVFLTLGLALFLNPARPAHAQTPAVWYWDTNGATAGAGSTPSGTWGSDSYWNSDPTGGAGTFQSGFNSIDSAIFVAGPGATSGDQAYTVTLAGPQSVAALSFESAGDATIAPSNPNDTNTAVSIGSGGLSIPQYAYGTTPQGNVTISSVATPTADATWSVDNGWLNLAGKFFTNQPYTTTLTGPGMTYVTSMNNGSAFGGSGNNLQLVVNNSAVSFANDGYYSPGAGVLSIPGGSYTVVPYITLDGGRLSYVYAGQILAQSTQYLTIGSGGGVLDFTQPVEWAAGAGINAKLQGGSVGAPVSLTKTGAGELLFPTAMNGSLYTNVKAYGGSIALYADGNFGGNQRTTRVYGLDILGGDVALATSAILDSSILASAGNPGQVKLRSAGGSLGVYRVMSSSQGAADLSADSGSAVYYLGQQFGLTVPDMATLADGRMWLGGLASTSATSGLAGSDGVYRILGNTYTGQNAFTGSGELRVGSRLYNGRAATVDPFDPLTSLYPTISASQDFSGTVKIAGPSETGRASASHYDNSQLTLSAANALGSVSAITVGANASLSLNTVGGLVADAAPITVDNGRLFVQGNFNDNIDETLGGMTVKGVSAIQFGASNTNNTSTIRVASLTPEAGGALVVSYANSSSIELGTNPKVIVANNTGTATYGGGVIALTGFNRDTGFVQNDPTNGMTPIAFQDIVNPTNWTASTYVETEGANLVSDTTVGGLKVGDSVFAIEVAMAGHTLTVESGGIIGSRQRNIGQYNVLTLGEAGANPGSITVGRSAPVIDGKPTLYLYSQALSAGDDFTPNSRFTINSKLTGTMNLSLVGLLTDTDLDTQSIAPFVLTNTANDFTGTVFFNNGSANVLATSDAVFGNAANQLTFNGGWLGSDITTSRQVNVLDGGATFTDGTFNGQITGSGPIMVGMAPYFVLGSNTFVGGAGAHDVTFGSADNDFTGVVRIFSNGTPNSETTLRTSAANVLGSNAVYSMQSNTLIDLTNDGATPAGFSQSMGSLEGTGDVNIGTSATLTVGGNDQNATFAGRILGGGDLVKTGAGSWVLNGQNGYAGTTTLGGGTLVLQSPENPGVSGPLGGASSTVGFAGGTLQYSPTNTFDYSARASTAASQQFRVDTNGEDVTWASNLASSGGTLTKLGAGTWTLSGINSYSGDSRVAAGTLALGGVDALAGSTLDLNTADAGTVSFTVAGTQTYNLGGLKGDRDLAIGANSIDVGANNQSTTYAGDLSGTGGVGKVGTGTLTLSGTNSYSGGTTIAGGTLALGSADALGSSGTIAFDGGTLQFSASNTTDYSSRFSNAASQAYNLDTNGENVTLASNLTSSGGTLVKTGAGTLTLSGTNSYSGGTTISAGTLEGSATSLQGSIANNATVEFTQATAGTYSGVMSGTGNFIKTGAGALTLSGNNSYDGTTTVSAGTLLINGNQLAATGSLSVLSGATLGGSGTLGSSMSLASGSTLSPGNSPGTITSASGSWAGGANYNVQIVDATGTSGTDWDLANFSGALDITATSGTPFLVNLWTLSSTGPDVDGNATNFSSNASYAWKIASAAGGVTGFTADKFTVNTSATNGTAGFANSFGSGQFSVANAGNNVNVVFTPAIVFDVTSGSQTQTQQGANASIDSALSVTKTGAGTVVMNGTNSYTAATSVNAGTMEVTGSITNSAVTVNSGGTLSGTGTVAQLATVLGGGTLAPGSAAGGTGVLSLGGLSLDSTATTLIAITGTTPGTDFDQVSILGSGALGFGGTLDLSTSNIDSATVGTSYRLFDFSVTPTGDFASLTPLGGIYSGITWSGPTDGVWTSTAGTGGDFLTFDQGTGTLAVVPEPSTFALAAIAGLGGLAALRRRRRSTSAT